MLLGINFKLIGTFQYKRFHILLDVILTIWNFDPEKVIFLTHILRKRHEKNRNSRAQFLFKVVLHRSHRYFFGVKVKGTSRVLKALHSYKNDSYHKSVLYWPEPTINPWTSRVRAPSPSVTIGIQ